MPLLKLVYQDKGGAVATHQAHLPGGLSAVERVGFINAIVAAVEPLTNARLLRGFYVTPYQFDRPTPPDFAESDAFSRLVAFFRNGEEWDFFRLPSPRATLPYDLAGPYRGRRLTASSAAGSPSLGALFALLAQTVQDDGTPFPSEFVVGCRTKGG